MSASTDRVQILRTQVMEVVDALNAFARKAEAPHPAIHGMRVAPMIRYATEKDFAVLVQKVTNIQGELNKLESDIEDDIQDAAEPNPYDDEREVE